MPCKVLTAKSRALIASAGLREVMQKAGTRDLLAVSSRVVIIQAKKR